MARQVRLWQVIVVLVSHLVDPAAAQRAVSTILGLLAQHEHPPSLRYLIEWAALRIYLAHPATIAATLLPYAAGQVHFAGG